MEEKIGEAAKKYAECREPHCEDGDCSPYCELMGFCCDRGIEVIKEYTEDAFKAGAKWALQNQWHDASKELPEDGIKVIVLTEKGNAAINSVYTFNGNRRWHSNYAVLFWMPIQSLPKELK